MSDVVFPSMSDDTDAQGVVITWFVESGERVEADDLIAEIAMDKIDMEIHAERGGILTVLVPEDQATAQGSVIARIE
ncbi:biotin attachment protein [Microbacterium mangrovi]|uniref:Biotin attachment protein n=1 Tax=Microbacterium mangrovi TaxID=1348253 RepID=A0A0B2A5W0_9MICO|nr:lipoyl domain-containing protein [Microbacterium mangrovi]KHK97129.1 biotin attachment protein [Microbacterium mangrovi]